MPAPLGPLPDGWPRLSSALFYDDASAAITWLERAFGFETRMKIEGENGAIVHSELLYGDGVVMVGSTHNAAHGEDTQRASPRSLKGANTQRLFGYVDDVNAHCARARAAGATILSEPKDTDYGEGYWADRGYEVADCEGHRWWFAQRLRTSP